jgi:hypothetical protein
MSAAWQTFVTGLERAAQSPEFAISVAGTLVVLILYHWIVVRRALRAASGRQRGQAPFEGPPGVTELRDRVAALEAGAARNLQYIGFVRFNAFEDVGSELSFSLAVVDGNGNGFIMSSIYSREEVRTYAKAVRRFVPDKDVSAEEQRALRLAQAQAARDSG